MNLEIRLTYDRKRAKMRTLIKLINYLGCYMEGYIWHEQQNIIPSKSRQFYHF